jgi:predicted DNA binding CopG/RHH family protein
MRYRFCVESQSGTGDSLYPCEDFTLDNTDDASRNPAKRIAPKRKGRMTTSQQPVRMKRLTLDLSEPLHRAIKKNAAEEGVTMAQKLRAILAEKYHFTEETP